MACSYHDDCLHSETCCGDDVCRLSCSEESDNTVIIVVVVCICIGIATILALIWYCRWRSSHSGMHKMSQLGSPGRQIVTITKTIMTRIVPHGSATSLEDNKSTPYLTVY